MADKKLVSVVLSFRNEEDVVAELVERLQKVFRSLPLDYELVFVNDASTDRSLQILRDLRKTDPAVKILNMSRRFGVSECALAGLEHARGDAVILMDADLQDPPEVIPEMVEKWREGADVVYTVRASRAGESAAKVQATRLAYKFIRGISEIDLPENAGDFKLISRRALTELLKMKHEKEPYLRGMVTWLGFRQVPVVYERQQRAAGKTHFPVLGSSGPAKMFLSGMASFSSAPLYALLVAGVLCCLVAGLALVLALVAMVAGANVAAWLPVTLFLFLLSGVQLAGLGLLGVYLGKVYKEVRRRPNYILESTIGFDEKA